MIREGDIGEKLFPDFPDMKVDFSEIGIGKIGKIGLAPPQLSSVNQYNIESQKPFNTFSFSVCLQEEYMLHVWQDTDVN